MIENITLEEVEYKNKIYFIDLEATYEIEKCECSSMCGDQYVTERWEQINLEETDVESVVTYDKNDEPKYVKIDFLLPKGSQLLCRNSSSDYRQVRKCLQSYLLRAFEKLHRNFE